MYGGQQQLQPLTLPPHLQQQHQQHQQQHHYYRRQQHYSTLPAGRRPLSCSEPLLRPLPCREPPPCPEPLPRPCREPPPCPEPPPPPRPPPCREPPPCPEPPPRPLPCFEPAPHQQQESSVAYDRVRTYGPGCRRVSTSCSSRAASPLECSHGYQQVISGCDPPQQGTIRRIIIENPDQEPLSPFLRGGNFFPGNNVIYEKTIRKYELLNPHQEKQYQFSQHCPIPQQVDQCHAEQSQVTSQCQQTQTSSPCEVIPVCVSDDCQGNTVRRVTVQTCEPVNCSQENSDQLDCRYFGELLAELNRKTNDLYSCLFLLGSEGHAVHLRTSAFLGTTNFCSSARPEAIVLFAVTSARCDQLEAPHKQLGRSFTLRVLCWCSVFSISLLLIVGI